MKRVAAGLAVWGVCATALPLTSAAATSEGRRPHTGLVSTAADGTGGDSDSGSPQVSANGRYIAFESWSANLLPGDTNGVNDIFVKDRRTGAVERVDVASDGTQADVPPTAFSISGNGRYVAFDSLDGDLVPGDTPDSEDIFLRDRRTGRTEPLIGPGPEGSFTYAPSLSADGRFVAFTSSRSDLVPGDTNGESDAFVHDRWTKTTRRVSVATDGTEGRGRSTSEAISADGTRIAFTSARRLGTGAEEPATDHKRPRSRYFYVHDTRTGRTTPGVVDLDGEETPLNGDVGLSPDGRHALFSSAYANLVPGDTNGARDHFARDLTTGVTRRLSLAHDGSEPNDDSGTGRPHLSADNRYAVFTSTASNLVPGDTNGAADAFLRDLRTGEIRRVDVADDGTQSNGGAGFLGTDASGHTVSFDSAADNLVPGDTNGHTDVFVRVLR
ncbi:TolB family protein [Streptomyces achromogenes]|uniref:TolB family protein n=1 Tax=Streptomyces achromogenes TaxID=67255 RepID=UPI0033FDA204